MAVFAWRRRLTRHFGEQWVPFAEVRLRSKAGRWHGLSLEVDSGAVVSVLRRSAADLLGIDYKSGEAIDLASVGSLPQRYAIHKLEAQIGDLPAFELRIAFAEREDVPNLLGRLDVLDRFQIDLDVSLEETRFSAPWLDANYRTIWRHSIATEAAILSKWNDHPLSAKLDEAAKRFVNRADQLVAAAAGLLKLRRDFELPLLIRSLFELSVQFEYLMRDPEARAPLYLDFEHVTRHRTGQAWLNLPGPIGEGLRRQRRPGDGEAGNRARYELVRPQYAAKRDPERTRSHWYPGTLRDVASEVGRTAEYNAIYGLYSAWAHGDPFTAGLLRAANGGLLHAFVYWGRLLTQVADAKKIILSHEQYGSLERLSKGLMEE
jgi:hypothetical protein